MPAEKPATARPARLLWIAVAAWAFLLGGCATFGAPLKRPTVNYEGVQFVAADDEALRLDLVFEVHNRDKADIELGHYDLLVRTASGEVAEMSVALPREVPSRSTTRVYLPARIGWAELARQGGAGQLFWASGEAHFRSDKGDVVIPFAVDGMIPTSIPAVRAAHARALTAQ